MRFARWLALCSVMTVCSVAQARDHARLRLSYARDGTAAEHCADEATFRALVAARLGYDPFADDAARALEVSVRPRGAQLEGQLVLTQDGHVETKRALSSGANECDDLLASIAFAAAVAIDPDALTSPRTTTTPPIAPTQAPRVETPHPAVATSHAPPSKKDGDNALQTTLDAGAVASSGTLPALGFGPRVGAAVGSRHWSIEIDASALLPRSRGSPYGSVSAWTAYASLIPCGHVWVRQPLAWDVCVAANLGAVRSRADGVTRSEPTTDFSMSVGPHTGITLMPWESLGLALSFEVPIALSRLHLAIDDGGTRREVWASSRIGFAGAAVVVLRL